jgi:hypothetical protein
MKHTKLHRTEVAPGVCLLTDVEIDAVQGGGVDGGIDRDPVLKAPEPIEPKDEYAFYVIGYYRPLEYGPPPARHRP